MTSPTDNNIIEPPQEAKARKGIFYGYWILAVAFVSLIISVGSVWWAFSLFVKPIEADSGWSRSQIMIAFTAYTLFAGAMAPVVGRLIDRHGAKRLIIAGAVLCGLALVSLAWVSHIWHLYVAYAVIGMGGAGLGHIGQSTIVSAWFHKRRGLAIGLMSTGVGLGGFIMSPIIGGYLIPNLGWKLSYLALGLFMWLTIVPLTLFVVKQKPAEMGLFPDGVAPVEIAPVIVTKIPKANTDFTLKAALVTSAFWLAALSFLASAFSQFGVLQNEVTQLSDVGFTTAMAATIHGMIGLFSAFGKLLFGWLCDRITPRYSAVVGHIFIVTGIVILMNLKATSPPVILWLYVLVFGLGLGAWLPTMSLLVSTTFGFVAYGAIIGMVSLAQSIGTSVGPLVANLMHTNVTGYRTAFWLFLVLYGIALPAMLLVRRPGSHRAKK